ncbi:MAG: hypothetical protein WCW47_02760 [Candidatus Paceibacterota bacterium]
MTNHKTIHDILESWGKNKQQTPQNNEALKREILSNVPVVVDKISPYAQHHSPWFSYAFATMAVITLLISYGSGGVSKNFTVSSGGIEIPSVEAIDYSNNARDSVEQTSATGNTANKIVASDESRVMYAPEINIYRPTPPVPQPSGAISDKREFLKINYNATLQTRQVSDTKNRIEIMVRGFNGRVDTSNSGDKWGDISFAIPKSEFDAFREEVKNLVGSRFYIEQTNSQNLLSQKQALEQNQKQVQNNLSDLNAERQQIVRNHNQNISLYQTRINSINSEVTTLKAEYKIATPVRQAEILNKINQLQVEIGNLESEIINENRNYQTKIGGVDTRIKYGQENLKYIETRDSNLIDDVATVNGSISLQKINLWNVADTYTPGPLLAWILLGLAIISYLWYRRSMKEEYKF